MTRGRLLCMIWSPLYKAGPLGPCCCVLLFLECTLQSSTVPHHGVVLVFGPQYTLSHIFLRTRMHTYPGGQSSFPNCATLFFNIPVSCLFSLSIILNLQFSFSQLSSKRTISGLSTWYLSYLHSLHLRGKKLSMTGSFGLCWKGHNYVGHAGTLTTIVFIMLLAILFTA